MKIAIYGYGNLGRGVESAVSYNPDMELTGVFTRRDPATVKTLTGVGYGGWGELYFDRNDGSLDSSFANGLFYNCTSLKTINWGKNIKTIGNIAFLNCSSLTDLVLPAKQGPPRSAQRPYQDFPQRMSG